MQGPIILQKSYAYMLQAYGRYGYPSTIDYASITWNGGWRERK